MCSLYSIVDTATNLVSVLASWAAFEWSDATFSDAVTLAGGREGRQRAGAGTFWRSAKLLQRRSREEQSSPVILRAGSHIRVHDEELWQPIGKFVHLERL